MEISVGMDENEARNQKQKASSYCFVAQVLSVCISNNETKKVSKADQVVSQKEGGCKNNQFGSPQKMDRGRVNLSQFRRR
jgi:hypothetical protein